MFLNILIKITRICEVVSQNDQKSDDNCKDFC